MYRLHADFNVM